MRCALGLVLLVAGTVAAHAGDCPLSNPSRPALNSETVEWSFQIASGRSCLRGLRYGTMTLDSVRITAPAKHGEATIKGYGFSYQAPDNFKGEDDFVVMLSGTNRGVRGTSTIHVRASVR